MRVLAASLLLLLAPSISAEVCKSCHKGKLCRPHREQEASEFERLQSALTSSDPRERYEALYDLSELASEHVNVPSAEVARALARAVLADDSLRVRERAMRLLTDGQDPEVTVETLERVLADIVSNMWTLVEWLMGPGEQRGHVGDAMNYLETAMLACGEVRDDRVVKALCRTLMAYPSEMRGQPVAMAATRSLLDLGSREAVHTVLKQFSSLRPSDELRNLHNALESFASELDLEDQPDYGEQVGDDWERWFAKHSGRLPKKLGKWKGKPIEAEAAQETGDSGDSGD